MGGVSRGDGGGEGAEGRGLSDGRAGAVPWAPACPYPRPASESVGRLLAYPPADPLRKWRWRSEKKRMGEMRDISEKKYEMGAKAIGVQKHDDNEALKRRPWRFLRTDHPSVKRGKRVSAPRHEKSGTFQTEIRNGKTRPERERRQSSTQKFQG